MFSAWRGEPSFAGPLLGFTHLPRLGGQQHQDIVLRAGVTEEEALRLVAALSPFTQVSSQPATGPPSRPLQAGDHVLEIAAGEADVGQHTVVIAEQPLQVAAVASGGEH